MKIPNKVNICGKTYRVSKNSKTCNSDGFTHKQKVVVGIKGMTVERAFENYLHEVVELVACEQHLRFTAADDDVVFVMNHKQFDGFIGGIASALYPMVK